MTRDGLVIGGPLRLLLGALLFLVALGLGGLGFRLGWGIGWMAWIPALALLMPAMALAGRRGLRIVDGRLERSDGWLFRRILVLRMEGCELEIMPTGGAWAVILHQEITSVPLAVWVSRRTAERIAALCDSAHPDGKVPRRETRRAETDR